MITPIRKTNPARIYPTSIMGLPMAIAIKIPKTPPAPAPCMLIFQKNVINNNRKISAVMTMKIR
jgi:hypothetical protein